jgi:flagellar biosynthetic protein FlhB
MAQESAGEKTEEATPKRLREARKKGQVPKSRDVNTIVVLIAMFGMLCMGIGWAGGELKELMRLCFEKVATKGELDGGQLWNLGKASFLAFGKLILPLALVGAVVAAFSGFLQVGPIFAMEPLKPQMKKLNALEGLKNMFKTQTFIELVKNVAKIGIVFYLAYSTIDDQLFTILQTTNIPIASAASVSGSLIFSFVIKVLLAFLVISLLDYMVQRKQFMKQMKMTKDEVKREYKQDEGDPHIKSHRKQLHREFAFGDARSAVKQSDAVVTNPVHVAIALKYDRQAMAAPQMMLKGQRAFADQIRKFAEEFDIPIMRNVPLAWALFDLEEGAEIPEELYGAVAEVLAYVYRMKQMKEKEEKGDNRQYV